MLIQKEVTMFNLLKQPIEKTSFEAWAKMADDIAKVAILAVPVMLYGNESVWFKSINFILLAIIIYLFMIVGRFLRQQIQEK
jgi:Kef-type K+ transport system membrane component KefB